MAADGLDAQGMVKLLQLLEREAQDMPEGLSFLSSHPLTTERIAVAEEKAKALGHAPSRDAELERLFEALKAKG
jgi:predicted Zn-dependent protease